MTSRLILKRYHRSEEGCTNNEWYRCSNTARVIIYRKVRIWEVMKRPMTRAPGVDFELGTYSYLGKNLRLSVRD